MPLIAVAELRITLDQIVRTDFLPGGCGQVAVRIDDEIIERRLDPAAFDVFLKRVIELRGITSASSS